MQAHDKVLCLSTRRFQIFPREKIQSESTLKDAGVNSSPAGWLIVAQRFLISFSTSVVINSYYHKQSHACKALALQTISF